MQSIVSIRQTVRGSLPRIPFERIARDILGSAYELSLVVCGDTLSRSMNKKYRKKTYVPNVLSFPLSKTEGEIFLNTKKAAQEAKLYGVPTIERIALLFVHGCFHLKGFDHGDAMERRERAILKKYGF